MHVENFKVRETGVLSNILAIEYPAMSYNVIRKLFRKKDIKINGDRISKDCNVLEGDIISFYIDNLDSIVPFEDIYEDENVLVVNKKRNIEVVSDNGYDLIGSIKKFKGEKVFPVHRLDRNTQGLVVFAKNLETKNELDIGFKNKVFNKFYLAQAYGIFDKTEEQLTAYLKKDSEKSFVYISDKKRLGYEEIKTNYKVLKQFEDYAIVEVELVTGKTHQIRAHLAHIGHFILGDEKYGNDKINKKYQIKQQNLVSYKLILRFSKDSKLHYLNNKIFCLNYENIDFIKKYK